MPAGYFYGIISSDIILAHTGFCVDRKPGAKFRRRHTVSEGHGIISSDIILAHTGFCVDGTPGAKCSARDGGVRCGVREKWRTTK